MNANKFKFAWNFKISWIIREYSATIMLSIYIYIYIWLSKNLLIFLAISTSYISKINRFHFLVQCSGRNLHPKCDKPHQCLRVARMYTWRVHYATISTACWYFFNRMIRLWCHPTRPHNFLRNSFGFGNDLYKLII